MEDWWAVFVQGGNMTERECMISDNPWAEIRTVSKIFNESDFGR